MRRRRNSAALSGGAEGEGTAQRIPEGGGKKAMPKASRVEKEGLRLDER